MSELNLYQRIVGVMEHMGAVGKGGKTSYGDKYEYHRIDDIDDRLRQALIANGVVATISEISERKLEGIEGTDKQGKSRTTWYAECHITVELVNADDPSQRTSIKGWGQGLDHSDKATGKAISYAAKAAYLSAFHLRGQPDNERDDIARKQAPALDEKTEKYITEARWEIASAKSLDDLAALGEMLKGKSAVIQNAVRQDYKARKQQLTENVENHELD